MNAVYNEYFIVLIACCDQITVPHPQYTLIFQAISSFSLIQSLALFLCYNLISMKNELKGKLFFVLVYIDNAVYFHIKYAFSLFHSIFVALLLLFVTRCFFTRIYSVFTCGRKTKHEKMRSFFGCQSNYGHTEQTQKKRTNGTEQKSRH